MPSGPDRDVECQRRLPQCVHDERTHCGKPARGASSPRASRDGRVPRRAVGLRPATVVGRAGPLEPVLLPAARAPSVGRSGLVPEDRCRAPAEISRDRPRRCATGGSASRPSRSSRRCLHRRTAATSCRSSFNARSTRRWRSRRSFSQTQPRRAATSSPQCARPLRHEQRRRSHFIRMKRHFRWGQHRRFHFVRTKRRFRRGQPATVRQPRTT